jgi:hypothetical protein
MWLSLPIKLYMGASNWGRRLNGYERKLSTYIMLLPWNMYFFYYLCLSKVIKRCWCKATWRFFPMCKVCVDYFSKAVVVKINKLIRINYWTEASRMRSYIFIKFLFFPNTTYCIHHILTSSIQHLHHYSIGLLSLLL